MAGPDARPEGEPNSSNVRYCSWIAAAVRIKFQDWPSIDTQKGFQILFRRRAFVEGGG